MSVGQATKHLLSIINDVYQGSFFLSVWNLTCPKYEDCLYIIMELNVACTIYKQIWFYGSSFIDELRDKYHSSNSIISVISSSSYVMGREIVLLNMNNCLTVNIGNSQHFS